jgi:hypothetical protein
MLRQIMNSWFEEYNQEIQDFSKVNDLKARFRSKKDPQHLEAFFELYLFILLKRLGFHVITEPIIPGYSTKPDFLATCHKTGKQFYLEATTVTEGNINFKRDKAILLVADKINKNIPCSIYAINLDWYGECFEHNINKEVIKKIENWVRDVNVINPIEFSFKDWFLRLTAIKVSSPIQRIVAKIGNIKVQSLSHKTDINIDAFAENRMDATSRIQNAILGKSKKYGKLDKPYIIAINVHSYFFNRIDLFEALLGREVVHFYENGTITEDRLEDGIWQKNKETISTFVNGVLSFFNLTPWTMFALNESSQNVPLFLLNPHSQEAFSFPEFISLVDENSYLLDMKKLQNIMRLPEEEWRKALEADEVS